MTSLRLDFGADANVVTVSDLNRRVRTLLENQFESLWVAGELSNVKAAPAGHWYFCLKDKEASVDCAMWRSRAQFLDFKPENGMQVEVRARVTLYEPRGSYQLAVDEIRRAGRGALHEAFEKLKAKLDAEGLFDEARKKSLPPFPRRIGLVTSPSAAALRDVLTTLRKRAPMIPVVLYPAQVQGEGAASQIARAIERANAHGHCDVLIVCRGGGSLEDLWAYNEEVVARAIVASRLPVVSGIGHETDFSIADFVADLRAATPTAAAVAASPDRETLLEQLAATRRRLERDMERKLERGMQRVDLARRRLLTPAERLARSRERLAEYGRRMRRALPDVEAARRENARWSARLRAAAERNRQVRASRLEALRANLAHLDPTQVLARGYSIVRDAGGHVRRTSDGLAEGAALDITFSEGGAEARVTRRR
jgi:exodeoxyribonuclease VII large subunit